MIFSRLFFALFELLVLDENEDPDSDPLELPLELFLFLCRLKSRGGGDAPSFFRLGAAIGDGAFLTGILRRAAVGEWRLFNDELRDFGRSIFKDVAAAFSFDR